MNGYRLFGCYSEKRVGVFFCGGTLARDMCVFARCFRMWDNTAEKFYEVCEPCGYRLWYSGQFVGPLIAEHRLMEENVFTMAVCRYWVPGSRICRKYPVVARSPAVPVLPACRHGGRGRMGLGLTVPSRGWLMALLRNEGEIQQ